MCSLDYAYSHSLLSVRSVHIHTTPLRAFERLVHNLLASVSRTALLTARHLRGNTVLGTCLSSPLGIQRLQVARRCHRVDATAVQYDVVSDEDSAGQDGAVQGRTGQVRTCGLFVAAGTQCARWPSCTGRSSSATTARARTATGCSSTFAVCCVFENCTVHRLQVQVKVKCQYIGFRVTSTLQAT